MTTFEKLNNNWNVEPNCPFPKVSIWGAGMKIVIAAMMVVAVASSALGTIAPPPPSGIVVTGAWEFVHADGSITNGIWTHDGTDCVPYMSKQPEEYAEKIGKTGVLILWRDSTSQRKCTIQEYSNGKENGYWVHWHPSGELQSCGILKDGLYVTGSFWHTNGTKAEIHVSTNYFNWSPDGAKQQ